MGRPPCCEKQGLKKGPWTPEEDQRLLAYIQKHDHSCWRSLPAKAGLLRCGKSCRLRWTNYLRPDIKRGKFSLQEEQTITQLHALLGNRWSAIATHLPKRTDNEIKNYWNTHLKKRLAKMGIDPVTHKPHAGVVAASASGALSKAAVHLSHTTQWESARLEAEARLAHQAKLRAPAPPPPPASTLSFSDSALFSSLPDAHGAAHPTVQPMHRHEEAEPSFSGTGFTGILHDGSMVEQNQRLAARDEADVGEHVEEEEDKCYWSSILNMVDSSLLPSAAMMSAVVPDAVTYLPAVEF